MAGALLATTALFSGFVVAECAPREGYRNAWSAAGGTLRTGMPDGVAP